MRKLLTFIYYRKIDNMISGKVILRINTSEGKIRVDGWWTQKAKVSVNALKGNKILCQSYVTDRKCYGT